MAPARTRPWPRCARRWGSRSASCAGARRVRTGPGAGRPAADRRAGARDHAADPSAEGVDGEWLGEDLGGATAALVTDHDAFGIAGDEQHLQVRPQSCPASATWRPFMPPGRPTSVIRRSIRGSDRSTCSACGAVGRLDHPVAQVSQHLGDQQRIVGSSSITRTVSPWRSIPPVSSTAAPSCRSVCSPRYRGK